MSLLLWGFSLMSINPFLYKVVASLYKGFQRPITPLMEKNVIRGTFRIGNTATRFVQITIWLSSRTFADSERNKCKSNPRHCGRAEGANDEAL